MHALPQHDHRHGMNHGHVAVDGQNRQEDDAAVISRVEHKANCFASRISKSPAIHVVVGPEGQAKGENQIRESQIQQKCVGEGFQIFILTRTHTTRVFPYTAEQNDDDENDWSDGCRKLDSIFLDTDVNSHVSLV